MSKKFSAYAQNPTICGMGIEETDITVSKRDVGVSHDHLSLSDIHNEHSSLKANNIMAHSNPNLKRKRHIAIDVETERGTLIFLNFHNYICIFVFVYLYIFKLLQLNCMHC